MALVNKDAAVYVKDADAPSTLLRRAIEIVNDDAKLQSLSKNISALGLKDSANNIAEIVIKLATSEKA